MRFFLSASLVLVLCGVPAARSQSSTATTWAVAAYSSSTPLPDAPSALLERQPAAQQTTPAAQNPQTTASTPVQTPSQQNTQPPSSTGVAPPGSAGREQRLPGETDEQFAARQKRDAAIQVKKEEGQRNLYVLPNFNSVIAGETPPLSPGQKWDLVYHTAKDPYTFTIAFIVAGLGEAEDTNTGYHWGAPGYFRRVGAAYGDNVDGAIWGNAILPIVLHQDPRFYRMGPGHNAIRRILWAAGSTVICYGDNGKLQANVSNVGGNIISGAISELYYPDDQRGLGLVFSNALTVSIEGAAGAQLLEFGPDLTARLERHRLRHVAWVEAKQKAKANGTPPPAFKDIPIPDLKP